MHILILICNNSSTNTQITPPVVIIYNNIKSPQLMDTSYKTVNTRPSTYSNIGSAAPLVKNYLVTAIPISDWLKLCRDYQSRAFDDTNVVLLVLSLRFNLAYIPDWLETHLTGLLCIQYACSFLYSPISRCFNESIASQTNWMSI